MVGERDAGEPSPSNVYALTETGTGFARNLRDDRPTPNEIAQDRPTS